MRPEPQGVEQLAYPQVGMKKSRRIDRIFLPELGKVLLQLGVDVKGSVWLMNPEVDKEGIPAGLAFLNERDGALDVIVHVLLRPGTIEGSIFIKTIFTG